MRTFLSSQPGLRHASRQHRRGFMAPTPHPSHRLQQIRGWGGGGRLGKQHGWRLEATPGNALLVCFIVFSVGLLPHVACSLVQARPCEPSGMPVPPHSY